MAEEMTGFRTFEDIEAWRKARELTRQIYTATKIGPFSKDIPLRDHVRRSALSVMANIAEGFERGGNREFLQFLSVAKGSAGEAKAQLYAAMDQGYLGEETAKKLIGLAADTGRMIGGLMRYLQSSPLKGHKYRQLPTGPRRVKPGTRNSERET